MSRGPHTVDSKRRPCSTSRTPPSTPPTPDRARRGAADSGRIVAVGPARRSRLPAGAEVIDAAGLILAPGFIDLQFNGAFGDDFTADPGTIWRVAEGLPRYGVTAFLPTIITSPLEPGGRGPAGRDRGPAGRLPRRRRRWACTSKGRSSTRRRRAPTTRQYLRLPTLEAVADWSPATGVRLVTLAPELPGALEVIAALAGARRAGERRPLHGDLRRRPWPASTRAPATARTSSTPCRRWRIAIPACPARC